MSVHPWLTPRVRTGLPVSTWHDSTASSLLSVLHPAASSLLTLALTFTLTLTYLSLQSSRTSSESATAPYNLATTTFMKLSLEGGIEPGPSAWESSTLPSEPLDVQRNMSIFSTYIVNNHAHCILHFHLSTLIIKTEL
jgi:hypothetical protein